MDINKSGENDLEEGCLSVPGKWGIVTRPNHVKVRALDENMEEFEINAKIKLNGTLWVGNVEIHDKASDWYVT